MKTTKEKFLEVVSKEENTSLERTRERVKNREVIREARYIAMKVLDRLEELGWSQKKLAEELKVSPQQVNKIVKGSENLTLETLVKLQNTLKISLLVSDLERQSYHTGMLEINHTFARVKKYSEFSKCEVYLASDYSDAIIVSRVPMMVTESPVIAEGKVYGRPDKNMGKVCFAGGEDELY